VRSGRRGRGGNARREEVKLKTNVLRITEKNYLKTPSHWGGGDGQTLMHFTLESPWEENIEGGGRKKKRKYSGKKTRRGLGISCIRDGRREGKGGRKAARKWFRSGKEGEGKGYEERDRRGEKRGVTLQREGLAAA